MSADPCRVASPSGTGGTAQKRELTEYEKGYLDGVLAYAYRSGGEICVGHSLPRTYESAALTFLRSRGIDTNGWKVNAR